MLSKDQLRNISKDGLQIIARATLSIALSRVLGIEALGRLALVQAEVVLISLIMLPGIERIALSAGIKNDRGLLQKLIKVRLYLGAAVIVVFAASGIHRGDVELRLVLGFVAVVHSISSLGWAVLTGRCMFEKLLTMRWIQFWLHLSVATLPLIWDLDVTVLLIRALLVEALCGLLACRVAEKRLATTQTEHVSVGEVLHESAMSVFQTASVAIERIFIGRLGGDVAVGAYAAAMQVVNGSRLLMRSYTVPEAIKIAASSGAQWFNAMRSQLVRGIGLNILVVAGTAIAALAFLAICEGVNMFTLEVTLATALLSLGSLSVPVMIYNAQQVTVNGFQSRYSRFVLATEVTSLAAVYLSFPIMGLVGVGIVRFFVPLIASVVAVFRIVKWAGMPTQRLT